MFGKRQALLKKFVASHLSVTIYHGLTTTNQIKKPYDSIGVCKSQLVNKSNSCSQSRDEGKHLFHQEEPSVPPFALLSVKYALQLW